MNRLIKIIIQAGEIALNEQKTMTVSKKEDTSLVSNGDLAVSKFLEMELKKLFPDYTIFSEENCGTLPTTDKVIVIDPIDGTESYSRREDSWSILVGFLDKGIATKGLVYQPTLNRLYFAELGRGAFLTENGSTIKLEADRLGPKIAIMAPNKTDIELALAKDLGIDQIIYGYSAGLKIMDVASSRVDLFTNFRRKCSIWDLVAPYVILKESGCEMFFRNEMSFNFKKILMNEDFIVCNKRIKPTNWKLF